MDNKNLEPITVEDQKWLLQAFYDMLHEMQDRLESKEYTNEKVIRANIENYTFIIELLEKQPPHFDMRRWLINETKRKHFKDIDEWDN